MKIYTKTGDDGSTGLLGGDRVSKDDLVIHTLGDLDELNATIGLAVAHGAVLSERLLEIQSRLFDLGAEVASLSEDKRFVMESAADEILKLEQEIDAADEELPVLMNFVLPGGTLPASTLHIARAVCRRAERSMVAVAEDSSLRPEGVQFLNRLADWLFTMARIENARTGIPETIWRKS